MQSQRSADVPSHHLDSLLQLYKNFADICTAKFALLQVRTHMNIINLLTANNALPNYSSTAEAVNKLQICSGLPKAYYRGFLLPERIYTPVAVRGNLM